MATRRARCLLLAATLGAVACGREVGEQDVATEETTATASLGPSIRADEGEWVRLPDPPGSIAPNAEAVWTGSELVLWGGGFPADKTERQAGAVYDPESQEWAELPPAPEDAPAGHTAVWTGSEVVYWGGRANTRDVQSPVRGTGLAYDPEERSWRRLAEAPIAGRTYHEAVWTGQEMVVWGGSLRCCPVDSIIHHESAAAYDPATDKWRLLADVPPPWSGDGGYAVSAGFDGDVFLWRAGQLVRLAAGSVRWDRAGPGGGIGQHDGASCWGSGSPTAVGAVVDDRLLMWSGGCMATIGTAFDLPGGVPHALAPAPHLTDFVPQLAPTSDALYAVNTDYRRGPEPGQGTTVWRYEIASDTWAQLPPTPTPLGNGAQPVWTGRELIVLPSVRGDDAAETEGWIFRRRSG